MDICHHHGDQLRPFQEDSTILSLLISSLSPFTSTFDPLIKAQFRTSVDHKIGNHISSVQCSSSFNIDLINEYV
ncbi:hypothetical protein AAFF_G00155260 [Aldrovandia affinis]|uniref:Uncharacterized protein n=1 Tax=Aldrovandia affinis TaxID=143900 RepID=A0AAD7T0P0_9TELE|nr:hypothetical protein AAFF_G00155260 [Aldrovandia affinis]